MAKPLNTGKHKNQKGHEILYKDVQLITYRRCDLRYMGEPLHARVSGHHFDIIHQRTDVSPVSEQFTSEAHLESHIKVMVSELSSTHDPCLLNVKEERWIRTLETLFSLGMNLLVCKVCLSLYLFCTPLEFPSQLHILPYICDIAISKWLIWFCYFIGELKRQTMSLLQSWCSGLQGC